MIKRIDEIRVTGDSIGGVVECVARNVPAGLGSPVFDKLEAELAKACMSLPASKGFEVWLRSIMLLGDMLVAIKPWRLYSFLLLATLN